MAARQPTPAAQLSKFLSRFPPAVITLAKRCLPKLRRAFPGCNQLVYNYSGSVVVSFTVSDRGYEGIVSLAVLPDGVRLYFDKSLPNPKGLLEGAGSKVRSVTVESASQLDRGDINELIKAAIKHSGTQLPRAGSNPMIIKSDSGTKKRKPKKAARAK